MEMSELISATLDLLVFKATDRVAIVFFVGRQKRSVAFVTQLH